MKSLRTYGATVIRTLRIGLSLYWLAAVQGFFALAALFGPPCGLNPWVHASLASTPTRLPRTAVAG